MNQFAPSFAFETGTAPFQGAYFKENQTFTKQLRNVAAQFQMHYGLVHRLTAAKTNLKNTTYVAILRNLETSSWTLDNLIAPTALEALFAGSSAVAWQRGPLQTGSSTDPLDRLALRYGVSIPFHNALGNHAALTLCDSHLPSIDLTELTRLALPLIEAILFEERSKHTSAIALSQRESHCLQWAAAGKTSIETGIILGLSPHTVNQYLTSATTKLGAVNRTHAVTKAVRLGLINIAGI